MFQTGPEYPIHFSLNGNEVRAISERGNGLLVAHVFGKIDIAGCVQTTVEPPSTLTFDTPMAALYASWQLESLARLSDDHLIHQVQLLIKMQK